MSRLEENDRDYDPCNSAIINCNHECNYKCVAEGDTRIRNDASLLFKLATSGKSNAHIFRVGGGSAGNARINGV